MTLSLFLLVLGTAFCHAGWNFAARKARGNVVALWVGLWLACAVLLPGVVSILINNGLRESVPLQGIGYIVATGLIHAVYFGLLAMSYERGEISVVYPVARGSGVGLTAVLAWLFLEEDITFLGAIGIALISVSVLSIGVSASRRDDKSIAFVLAVFVGVSIVAYSLVDKIGVSYINPVLYIWLMFVITAVVLSPFVVFRYRGKIGQMAKHYIRYSLIIGIGSMATYLMILFAFTLGPVSYIVSIREFAVVLAALSGIAFLREKFTLAKTGAIVGITIGIICIKIS